MNSAYLDKIEHMLQMRVRLDKSFGDYFTLDMRSCEDNDWWYSVDYYIDYDDGLIPDEMIEKMNYLCQNMEEYLRVTDVLDVLGYILEEVLKNLSKNTDDSFKDIVSSKIYLIRIFRSFFEG